MANRTREKIAEVHKLIKEYDGGVKRWLSAGNIDSRNFYLTIRSNTITERKKELLKAGVKVLNELRSEEDKFIKDLENQCHG